MMEIQFNHRLIVAVAVHLPFCSVGQRFFVSFHVAARFQIGQKSPVLLVGDFGLRHKECLNGHFVRINHTSAHGHKYIAVGCFYRFLFARTE